VFRPQKSLLLLMPNRTSVVIPLIFQANGFRLGHAQLYSQDIQLCMYVNLDLAVNPDVGFIQLIAWLSSLSWQLFVYG
jgi:hypothetical protein